MSQTQEFDPVGRAQTHVRARLKQAFLAQAVADAFCYPYEFNKPGIAKISADYAGNGTIAISDDTQMAMFGLYALGAMRRAGWVRDVNSFKDNDFIKGAYLAWYRTQTDGKLAEGETWLEREEKMRRTRAPGMTCMGSMRRLAQGVPVRNDSKGNGAVMRTLPFVFAPDLLGVSWDDAVLLAVEAGKLTHLHTESTEAVRNYMGIAHALISGHTITYIGSKEGSTFTALPALWMGVGLVAEALNDSFYEERFGRTLINCSVADIDSDTVAAIFGGLYGLRYPAPTFLIERLKERDVIEKLVDWACP